MGGGSVVFGQLMQPSHPQMLMLKTFRNLVNPLLTVQIAGDQAGAQCDPVGINNWRHHEEGMICPSDL